MSIGTETVIMMMRSINLKLLITTKRKLQGRESRYTIPKQAMSILKMMMKMWLSLKKISKVKTIFLRINLMQSQWALILTGLQLRLELLRTKEKQYHPLLKVKKEFGFSRFGLMANYGWIKDPKRILFSLSRYKFVAKMLSGKKDSDHL